MHGIAFHAKGSLCGQQYARQTKRHEAVAIKSNLESRLAMASSSAILVEFFKRAHKDKLQTMKLVYYAQAHHLIFFERPLFVNDLQAWELGPVPLAAYRSWNDPPSVPLSPDLTLFLTLLLRWFPTADLCLSIRRAQSHRG